MTRLDPANLMLCHDGTLEGFLSCVFDAYALHVYPLDICAAASAEPRLGQEVRDVETDPAHASRVRSGLVKVGGEHAYREVKIAFLSDAPGREMLLFSYIVLAFSEGRKALSNRAHPCVAQVSALATSVYNERENVFQFLRFEELEGGVYLARIEPSANVIPIMMGHFVERFNTQPFIIYDEHHRLAGVWDGHSTSLVLTDGLTVPDRTADELAYQRLWKTFYDSIANEQRYNPDLRASLMPKRFWKHMPEMRAAVESREGASAS